MKKTTLAMAASVLAMTATAVFAQAAAPSRPAPAPMNRAEATAMANEMWTKMDVNKDGVINQADREARRTQKFDQMDTNKDGSLSRDEFNAAHPAQGPGEGGMDHQHGDAMNHGDHGMMGDTMAGHEGHRMGGKMDGKMGGHMRGMGMMMMHMADANKDGSVTRAEFDAAVKQHFDQADTNKDGTISPAEHRAAHAEMKKHMQSMRGGAQ